MSAHIVFQLYFRRRWFSFCFVFLFFNATIQPATITSSRSTVGGCLYGRLHSEHLPRCSTPRTEPLLTSTPKRPSSTPAGPRSTPPDSSSKTRSSVSTHQVLLPCHLSCLPRRQVLHSKPPKFFFHATSSYFNSTKFLFHKLFLYEIIRNSGLYKTEYIRVSFVPPLFDKRMDPMFTLRRQEMLP